MQPLVLSYRPRYIHEYCFEIIKMGYQCSQWWSGTDTRYTVDYYEGYPGVILTLVKINSH